MNKLRVDCAFELKAVSDDGRIEGHGAVFGNIDFGMDRIERGAFKDWLKGTKSIPMLWQHFSDEPIGVWDDLKEDKKGLFVGGQLNLSKESGQPDVPLAWKARALAKQRAVTGLSIGYQPVDFKFEDEVRVLERVDVLEVSLATFPMNDRARVTGVKHWSRVDLERALREQFGLSWKAAQKFLDQGFDGLSEPLHASQSAAAVASPSAATEKAQVYWALKKMAQQIGGMSPR